MGSDDSQRFPDSQILVKTFGAAAPSPATGFESHCYRYLILNYEMFQQPNSAQNVGRLAEPGHSWGAWLSCLLAADYPLLVRKLILIGPPAFEERYVAEFLDNRLKRFERG